MMTSDVFQKQMMKVVELYYLLTTIFIHSKLKHRVKAYQKQIPTTRIYFYYAGRFILCI